MTKEIVFATNNINKLNEIREIVGSKFKILSLSDIGCHDDIPEDGKSFKENALIKASHIKNHYGYDCFADDSGLEVKSLDGAPGIYSARYAGVPSNSQRNIEKLLHELADKDDRTANFTTVVALIYNGSTHFFEGKVFGEITKALAGADGFGYDPVFKPTGYDYTFAQMSHTEKNTISHRGIAIRQLLEFLQQ